MSSTPSSRRLARTIRRRAPDAERRLEPSARLGSWIGLGLSCRRSEAGRRSAVAEHHVDKPRKLGARPRVLNVGGGKRGASIEAIHDSQGTDLARASDGTSARHLPVTPISAERL
jgi:hypothetical protein